MVLMETGYEKADRLETRIMNALESVRQMENALLVDNYAKLDDDSKQTLKSWIDSVKHSLDPVRYQ